MKKIVFLLSFILSTNLMFAQLSFFSLGPKIGYTTSKIHSSLNQDYNDFSTAAKSGLMIGAFARISLKKYYIQPEIYFATKNSTLNYDFQNKQISQSLMLSTVDIPVLFGYKLFSLPELNVRACLGPVASFIVNKNISNNDIFGALTKDDFKDQIWGGQVGVGVDLFMLTIDIRYEIGLNDISSASVLGNTKNNLFFVSLGWKIL